MLILFVLIMSVPQVARLITMNSLRIVDAVGVDPSYIVLGLDKFRFWEKKGPRGPLSHLSERRPQPASLAITSSETSKLA